MIANFWRRFVATIIDCSIIVLCEIILIFITLFIILVMDITDVNKIITYTIKYVIFYPSYFILPWLYYALMESSEKKATVGKLILNLIVVDLQGNKISFKRASKRFCFQILSIISLCIGFIISCFTKRKQALHCSVVNTLVIYNNASKLIQKDEIKVDV